MQTKEIIQKWYRLLEFPVEFDAPFAEALETYEVSPNLTAETCDYKCTDGKQNLLNLLFLCQQVQDKADERGIPQEIVVETLKDIVIWTKVHSELQGELYLGELGWLAIHMKFQMFRLGRLQFRMWKAYRDMPEAGIQKGDNVMEIHIPRGSRLDPAECDKSFARAKEFFATYFPEFSYTCFTCNSWLLDEDLKEFLPEESNILHFGNRFTKVYARELNCLLSSVFRDDTTEENLADAVCTSAFSRKVKEAVLGGKMFHMTLGFIPK